MSLAVSHGAVTLSAECSDEYNSLVEGFFALVQKQLDRGAKLRDGVKAPFGWTELRVSMVDDVAVFQEPDFDTDPLTRSRRNLDFSLAGYQRQQMLIDALGIGRWEPLRYSDTVFVEQGAISAPKLVAKRITDSQNRSTWLVCDEVGAAQKLEITPEVLHARFGQIPVWHLYDVRAALFDALALPNGFQVRISDAAIVEITNDQGDRWSL